jgi:hypothetical protein
MARAGEIAALRAFGLTLAQVARVLGGDRCDLEEALAAHQATLEVRARDLAEIIEKVRGLQADLARGHVPATADLTSLLAPAGGPVVAFDLPWPWGGERFELREARPLNHIVGPLGSGKTRLILRLAEVLPGAAFLGLDRLADDGAAARAELERDAGLRERVHRSLAALVEDGAEASGALVALLAGLEAEGPAVLVVDMLEQGLE